MGKVKRKLTGISKMLMVIVIAAIVIVAAVVGAWWFFLRPTGPAPAISLKVSSDEVEPGVSVTVSGSTSPVKADANVTLTYSPFNPEGSNVTRFVDTDADGKFEDTFSSDLTGRWDVTAQIEEEISDPATFYVFVKPALKIGVIGPMEQLQGRGMREGAILAAEEINDAGGVLGHKFVVVEGDEGVLGQAAHAESEMTRLITKEGVDMVVGGFRTEQVMAMREVPLDHQKIFFITGAATNHIINCFGSLELIPPCGECVRCLLDPHVPASKRAPEKFKYLFRVMPPNSTVLFSKTLVPIVKGYVLPLLGGTPKTPVGIACVVEAATWTNLLWDKFLDPVKGEHGLVTGLNGYIDPELCFRPSPDETDFKAILGKIKEKKAGLIIHVFAEDAGLAFIKQWGEMEVPALPVGVDVLAQESGHWDDTDGYCEYETILSSPPRVAVAEGTIPFWDAFVERWGHDPLYTSFGTYDALYSLKEAVELAGVHPPITAADSDAIVEQLETQERMTNMGKAKFDRYHDPYIEEILWFDFNDVLHQEEFEYVQPLVVQWIDGERKIIFPFDQTYTEELQIPPWM